MKCSNCEANLRTDFVYCPACGAKTEVKRITFSSLLSDVYERFLNLDNTFFRTFKKLTLKPEEVIGSYLGGARRRYMNPMNYLGVALAVSGLMFLVMRNKVDALANNFEGLGVSTEVTRKILEFSLEYHAFVFLLYIPVIALAGYLTFNKRDYNLPEHIVSATYTLSHFTVVTTPVSLLVLAIDTSVYLIYSFVYIGLMLAYTLFVLLRVHPYEGIISLVRAGAYASLFAAGYFGISILLNLLMLAFGVLELKDLAPQGS